MKVPVELAYLNGVHFHITDKGGVNMKDRLDTRDKSMAGLKLEWDTETKELAVTYHSRVGYVVGSNVKVYFPFEKKKEAEIVPIFTDRKIGDLLESIPKEPLPPSVPHKTKISAQASTPLDHVFAGPGGGKTK